MRSLKEREAQRKRYRDRAIGQAESLGMTLRCRQLQYDMDHPNHQLCCGEDLGNSGCLCRCHDVRQED